MRNLEISFKQQDKLWDIHQYKNIWVVVFYTEPNCFMVTDDDLGILSLEDLDNDRFNNYYLDLTGILEISYASILIKFSGLYNPDRKDATNYEGYESFSNEWFAIGALDGTSITEIKTGDDLERSIRKMLIKHFI